MIGTWINIIAILSGTFIGLLFRRGIPGEINKAVLRAEGLAICIIALNGVIGSMFRIEGEALKESGGILLLLSLVIGCVVGELLRLEERLDSLGAAVESKLQINQFAKGFVAASLIFPVGAMSLIGALKDGLTGDSSILILKSSLDGITSIVLASTLGVGVAFSVLPVLLVQGGVSLMAVQLQPYLTDALLNPLCMVGYAIVLCIGLNFLLDARIRVANLLPALLVPLAHYVITLFFCFPVA